MSNIDKQAVQTVADLKAGYTLGHADVAILKELARIALASLELERGMIRRFDLDMSDCDSCGQDCGADMVEDLDGEYVLWDEVLPHLYRYDEYTATPAPVSLPDEDLLHMAASAIEDLLSNKDRSGAGVWADVPAKLRRAAMLQGADGTLTNEGTIPVTQFKPVADLYGLTSPTGGETSFTFDAVEARDFIDGGWSCQEYVELGRFQKAMLQNGNSPAQSDCCPEQNYIAPAQDGDSPVIPDGWVLVPEEPTHEMLEAGDEQFGTYDVYRRMIAASPQQK
ncbi:hypothetical protein [Enterobacter hormaechei]|uniref:hypothetical protein n=1 Tax=Enterobacter hormaechei TaxID=158836 RepID=UPI0024151067|nr:hypothetical protein [Enterobacter hormaechei]MDG4709359.1 hypothetical protein [Enterobacter hormaechei]